MIRQPVRSSQVESYLKAALAEKPDKPPLVGRIWETQEDETMNNSSFPDPLFELLAASNLDEVLRAGSEEGSSHDVTQGERLRCYCAFRDRQKCVSEHEAAGIVGLEGLPPFNLMLGTSLRATHCAMSSCNSPGIQSSCNSTTCYKNACRPSQ